MEERPERVAEAIDFLLEGAHDNVGDLQQAARLARNPTLRSFFSEQAKAGEALVSEIEGEARSFGPSAARDGTLIGEAHRAFTRARNAIARGSDKALVEEAARGAGMIANRFEEVCHDQRMPEPARQAAARALASLQRQQTEIEKLAGQYD